MTFQGAPIQNPIADSNNMTPQTWVLWFSYIITQMERFEGLLAGTDDHTNLLNIGVQTHPQIDSHIGDTTRHFLVGSIDHGAIGGLTDDDHMQYILVTGTRAFTGAITTAGRVEATATKTGSYVLTNTDEAIIFNVTSAVIATLPDPTANTGQRFTILNKYTSTADVTFTRSINGDSSFALAAGEQITIRSDGTEYLL